MCILYLTSVCMLTVLCSWVLPGCLAVAGAVHGALLQAGSRFPGAPQPPTLAGNPSEFWTEAILFYKVSTKEPWSAEALRPACVCHECKMRLGWALFGFWVSQQVLLLARADPCWGSHTDVGRDPWCSLGAHLDAGKLKSPLNSLNLDYCRAEGSAPRVDDGQA